jgi:hypothetical protein
MKQCRAAERCADRRVDLGAASHLGGIDLAVRERAVQHRRIAAQMLLEEIDAPAMQRHRRRVRKFHTVRRIHLEDGVLRRRIAAVRLDDDVHRRDTSARIVERPSAEGEEKRCAFDAERVRRTSQCAVGRRGPAEHRVDHLGCADLALKRGSRHGGPEIPGAESVEHLDDAISADVRGVRERWTPVAVFANESILMEQLRVLRDQVANGVDVVAPDGVDELHRLYEPRPARRLVAPRQNELRVGKLGGGRVDRIRVKLAELGDRGGIAGVDRAEQIFGLVLELVQVGNDGQATSGHDEPPRKCPGSACVGRQEVRENRTVTLENAQVDSVLSADGRRPARPPRE